MKENKNLKRAQIFENSESYIEYEFEKTMQQVYVNKFFDIFFYNYLHEKYVENSYAKESLYFLLIFLFSTSVILKVIGCISVAAILFNFSVVVSILTLLSFFVIGTIVDKANDYLYLVKSDEIEKKY